ncbi:MAG: ATP-dependent DNA helicase [Thermoproteota archaeon]
MQESIERLARRYFPYPEFRERQLEAIGFIFRVLTEGKIGLLSSPCGTGKSISILTAYLMAREVEETGKLLILTRTRNELEIYAKEIWMLAEKSLSPLRAVMIISKQEMCPLARGRRLSRIDYRSFLKYCSHLKNGSSGESCSYYSMVYRGWKPSRDAEAFLHEAGTRSILSAEEFYMEAYSRGMCPYELTKLAASDADLIIGNYNHFLIEEARRSIFARGRMQLDNVNIVFDEAHSLPFTSLGLLSDEFSSRALSRARREVVKYGVDDEGFLTALKSFMEKLGNEAKRLVGIGEDHVLEEDESSIVRALKISEEEFSELLGRMSDEADRIIALKMESGKQPVSYIDRTVEFVWKWVSEKSDDIVRYVRVERDGAKEVVKLGVSSMDASRMTSRINMVRSALLMSGTLWNFEYYVDVLGLDGSRVVSMALPSPFKRENRLILVDKGVTTKYELREDMVGRIAERLSRILQSLNGRAAVYFPSYELMNKVSARLEISIPVVKEDLHTKIKDILRFLRKNHSCVAMGVARGKISEGVDLTGEGSSLLSAVIIVGLPYPKRNEMHEKLLKYYEKEFGEKAFQYASVTPCVVAIAQMAGRLIRSQRDRGVIIIMDSRVYGMIGEKLPKDWREDMKAYLKIENLVKDMKAFLNH